MEKEKLSKEQIEERQELFQNKLKELIKESEDSQEDDVAAVFCVQLLGDGINVGAGGDPRKISAALASAMDMDDHIDAIVKSAVTLTMLRQEGGLDDVLKDMAENKPKTEA
jgi:hypothetical protein